MQKSLSFRDLHVWQLSMDLVVAVYRASGGFPVAERYGLTSQIRRAVVSIPSNIAEGQARRADNVFLNHLRISLGSQAELLTLLEAARRLGYLEDATTAALTAKVDEVRRLVHGLRRSLEKRQAANTQ